MNYGKLELFSRHRLYIVFLLYNNFKYSLYTSFVYGESIKIQTIQSLLL